VKPTSARLLVSVALVAGLLGWVVASLADSLAGRYLPVSWTATGAIWLLALALAMWTWTVRPQLLHYEGKMPLAPHVAARSAALALASSRTGAAVAGAYLGLTLTFLGALATPAGSESAVAAVVAALGGLVVVLVALWLERLCRIDDDEEPSGPVEEVD
jgi:hypothetical protein